MSEEALLVFVSYSRVDLDWLNKFNKQLASLVRTQKIKIWHDRDIEAGNEWEPEIQRRLNSADIIILLNSADFMASDYCYGKELTRAIARHDAGEAVVIPVILRPCVWNLPEVPFSKLNVLPDHARPITRWEDPDEALAAVALHISNRVDALRQRKIEQAAEQQRQESEKLRQAEAQERQRQAAEQLRQQQAAEAARLKQQELARQQQEQQKQEAASKKQQEALKGNYAQLEALLKAGKWKEADQETAQRMCEVMGRQKEGWLEVKDIQQLPCADIRTIDQLWVKYSDGKFGFSVQKKIWQSCGSPEQYNKEWEKFGVEVGWRTKGFMGIGSEWLSYKELTFTSDAPFGHLPLASRGWFVGRFKGVISLFSHTDL